mgnify:CR=1 FL=1
MTQKKALLLRDVINALFSLTDPDRYCVAIAERFPATPNKDADYELHLYLRNPKQSGLIDLGILARVIEEMGSDYLSCESTYDAGTKKGEDIRNSVKIW